MIPGMDRNVQHAVRIEQMRMLFETPLPGMLMATAFAFALAWHLQGTVADGVLAGWLIVKCLAVAPRVAHAVMFGRRRRDDLAWLHWGVALLAADGITWGFAGVVLMVPGDPSAMTVVAASLAGMAAIAAFAIHADWRACAAFTSGALLPVVGYFLWRADDFGLYGAASITTFLALLLAAARRSERHVVELLALRFGNASLTERLSDALKRAQQDSRAKDAFVATMSHELRTPLHGILGLARALAHSVPAGDRERVHLIRRSGEHLLGLINNVLEFSRFKAHGIDMHPGEVDVARAVADVVDLCRTSAQERRLELHTEIMVPGPHVVMVDPIRLGQILINLIGNAIKFTDPGGQVRVRLAGRADGSGISISVTDTGVGMGADDLAQLFEPFRQGDASASRRHGGTGLGLHITRAICRRMGGDVSCRSEPGHGSTFVVDLPLARIAGRDAVGTEAAGDSGFAAARFGGGRVLLAEDNEVNALVAVAMLERFGLQVEHVDTGRGVVRRLCTQAERPDIVLLDCQMPEMDGFEACRAVRAFEFQHGLERVPIVALTANVFRDDRQRCLDAGMDDFLGKPFTERELHQTLARHAIVAAGAEPADVQLDGIQAARP